MATSLTGVGILWATLSLAAALLCCSGFYLPFWIQGRLLGKVDAYFSSFRRCNYPRVSPQGVVEIVQECGRYSKFWDIPSPWWQASTVLVGTGSALSLLIAVTATAACCITYVVHSGTARVAGSLQLTAALLVIVGAAVYPVGWDNREVRESCGNSSHIYRLGESRLVSDLNAHHRDCVHQQQRVASRLANPTASVVVQEFVQSATVNVPFSPIVNDVNDTSVVVRDLPKCLMKSDGNVFD
ncbi:LHFPL tetraspan subfamily member 6 protein isoform X1 [Tribolium castaneum]|uniref:LHFPL tetraspan subfamily member 6 protein isoform X1 n=1 Tax=Tribolium castaneum TaxID=7070 RepID=UPI0001DCC6E5|nr:PREDICTED: lipoma HMGIC fusion partner homolog isoform X1 [Tribolium castaneum]|eukprot:XP_008201156.1 PREDICTED: lipoma HMGIC fusion partner homolog isoform X1 [Tribolium castaneum]